MAPPGLNPIQNPIMEPRRNVRQYRGSSRHVSTMSLKRTRGVTPRNRSPSSTVRKISPRPKSPMTATMNDMPRMSSIEPKVSRSRPVTTSSPIAPRMNPSTMDAKDFTGLPPPSPMKLEKVSSWIAKNSGGPNLSASSARGRAKNDTRMMANSAPMNDEVKAAVSAWAALPLLRQRVPVERGRHRPRLARDVEQDRRDRPSEERAPVDTGEQDDGGSGRHREGQRQQDRHAVRAAQTGKHADDRPQHDSDHGQDEVERRDRDLEAEQQALEPAHLGLSTRVSSRGGPSAGAPGTTPRRRGTSPPERRSPPRR